MSFCGLQSLPVAFGKICDYSVFAQLKRTDIRHDRPPIVGRNLCAITVHNSESVGNCLVEVTGSRVAQPLLVKRLGSAFEAVLYGESFAGACVVMARRAENVEALLAALDDVARDRKRK